VSRADDLPNKASELVDFDEYVLAVVNVVARAAIEWVIEPDLDKSRARERKPTDVDLRVFVRAELTPVGVEQRSLARFCFAVAVACIASNFVVDGSPDIERGRKDILRFSELQYRRVERSDQLRPIEAPGRD
jgi:hypothetical protein